jgi:hypothetical protein
MDDDLSFYLFLDNGFLCSGIYDQALLLQGLQRACGDTNLLPSDTDGLKIDFLATKRSDIRVASGS